MECSVYKVYGTAGGSVELLYVGIADDFDKRWQAHLRQSWWLGEVQLAGIWVQVWNCRDAARQDEAAWINELQPRHNTAPELSAYRDYLKDPRWLLSRDDGGFYQVGPEVEYRSSGGGLERADRPSGGLSMMGETTGYAVIPRAIQQDPTVSANAKLVYLSLSSRADGRNQCWPRIRTIAADSSISDRAVHRALAELRDLGVLSWEQQKDASGSMTSSLYTLTGPTATRAVPPATQAVPPTPMRRHPTATQAEQERTSLERATGERKSPAVNGEVSGAFDALWSLWPRKIDKQNARKNWDRYVAVLTVEEARHVYTRARLTAEAYSTYPRREQQHIPYLTTWLAARRWNDDDLPPIWDERRTLTRNERNMVATIRPDHQWGSERLELAQ